MTFGLFGVTKAPEEEEVEFVRTGDCNNEVLGMEKCDFKAQICNL